MLTSSSLFWKKIAFRSVHFWNDFFQFSNNVMKEICVKELLT